MNNNNGNGGVAWAMDTVLSPYVQIPLTEFCNDECIERNLDRGTWRVNPIAVSARIVQWLGIEQGQTLNRLAANYSRMLDVALCAATRDMTDLTGGIKQ
jgi:hypothetical protein